MRQYALGSRTVRFALLALFAAFLFPACEDEEPAPAPDLSDDVFELAVRRINDGVSIAEFTAARDAFVAKLMAEEGTSNDREVQPFFDFLSMGIPLDSIYIGMTQYQDLSTYSALGQELLALPEAAAFLNTFTPLVFEALQPIEGYGPVDLSELAPAGSGQVLEIAVRNLNLYDGFNETDYEAKRDAFLAKLSAQEGFLREVQWSSALNPGIVVGMTVYESQAAVTAINSDPAFTNSAEAAAFIGNYPPNVLGTLNTVLK